MIYARIRNTDGDVLATLDGFTWKAENPTVASVLNHLANPGDYGPAYGDPVVFAANKAAAMLHGTAEITPLEAPVGDDIVY